MHAVFIWIIWFIFLPLTNPLKYLNIHSPTCEVFSTPRCWEEQNHPNRLPNCFTMWALRSICPGALVQRWVKTPFSKWGRYHIRWLDEESDYPFSRSFTLWLVLLQDKGWHHHFQCGHQRWFILPQVIWNINELLLSKATNSNDILVCCLLPFILEVLKCTLPFSVYYSMLEVVSR